MKKKIFSTNMNLKKQKYLYYILIGLALISLITGILFIFLISKDDINLINDKISNYFLEDKNNLIEIFFKSLFNYFIYILLIWILGISIFGIIISIIILMFKSFLFGFSLVSIISTFKYKGILISIIHLFPHNLLYLVVLLLTTFYSCNFSIKLFKHLFLKVPINFKEAMNKYFRILIISLFSSIILSLYEAFISNILLNMFN